MSMSRRVLARGVARELAAGVDIHVLAPQLAAYVIEEGMTKQLDELINDIVYECALRGDSQVVVTTARPLTEDLRTLVMNFVRTHESASTISLAEVVDSSLVGGIVIETPSRRFDASVASSLKQLKMT